MKAGTSKPRDLELEDQIRATVERTRAEHPYRGDYRAQLRALIEVLFFQFGERPGASRLVALLAEDGRSPSTSTAQDEINKFWTRLQEQSKVRIQRPDLPDFLLGIFGQAAATVWENALAQADAALAAFRDEASSSVQAAEARAASALERAERAEVSASQAADQARAADALREEMAVNLASEKAARDAAEKQTARLRTDSEERDKKRAEEIAALHRTIEDLRAASDRVEREQRRLLTVSDDYKTAAARDRDARLNAEKESRELMSTIQSQQGQLNRVSGEKGMLEGRVKVVEMQLEKLQKERDDAMARATASEARVQALEHALAAMSNASKQTASGQAGGEAIN